MRDKFGVWAPRPTAAGLVTPTDHDLILTPLVGYTRKGDRLGFGGGFYDRLFDAIGHTANLPLKGAAHIKVKKSRPIGRLPLGIGRSILC